MRWFLAGKTHLLTSIANTIPHTNSLYLAYNKSIATEAQRKFPSTTQCSTTHSLAYRAIVSPLGLRVGTFTYRAITEHIAYDNKALLIELIREFCLSEHLDFTVFAEQADMTEYMTKLGVKYLNLMATGQIECTHDFYLKAFHIHLADGSITYPEFDFVMLDEAGDVNPVTLEIFKLLPAKFKIAVGDKHQNIYSFNHTINAFELLADQAVSFDMTKSFRVAASIASDIQSFAREFLHETMSFEGIPVTDSTITSRAYLARTNSALVDKMIQLQESNIPYSLVRKASDIYRIPLMVCGLKYQGTITVNEYRHLQDDIDYFYEEVLPNHLGNNKPTLYSFLLEAHEHDYPLVQAIKLVISKSKQKILAAYEHAKLHERNQNGLVLSSVHSSKGLEFDEVIIADDLNDLILEISQHSTFNEDDVSELNLAYVAASRARKSLVNARFLKFKHLPQESQ